jgi:hypothetical protein
MSLQVGSGRRRGKALEKEVTSLSSEVQMSEVRAWSGCGGGTLARKVGASGSVQPINKIDRSGAPMGRLVHGKGASLGPAHDADRMSIGLI